MTQHVEIKHNDKDPRKVDGNADKREANSRQDEEKTQATQRPAKKNLVYVHEPGTVHLNAFEGAVAEAKAKRDAAESEYQAAIVALEDKKASSQFVEE